MSAHQKKVETAKITRDMTQGNPYGHMVAFAMPVLLSQIFQQLYNTADTFIVGKFLGTDALAAVSSSGTLIFLLISFFMGTSMGAGVVISAISARVTRTTYLARYIRISRSGL